MDLYFLENWHVLRLVTIGLLVVAFVLFAALVRAFSKARTKLGEGRTVSGAGIALPAPQTPASWPAKAADPRTERRAA